MNNEKARKSNQKKSKEKRKQPKHKGQDNAFAQRQNDQMKQFEQILKNDPIILNMLQQLHKQQEQCELLQFMRQEQYIFNKELCDRHIPQMEESIMKTHMQSEAMRMQIMQKKQKCEDMQSQIIVMQNKIEKMYKEERQSVLRIKSLQKNTVNTTNTYNSDQNLLIKKKIAAMSKNKKIVQQEIPKYNSKQLIVDMLLKSKKTTIKSSQIVQKQKLDGDRNKQNSQLDSNYGNRNNSKVFEQKIRSARIEANNKAIQIEISRLKDMIRGKMEQLDAKKKTKKKLIKQYEQKYNTFGVQSQKYSLRNSQINRNSSLLDNSRCRSNLSSQKKSGSIRKNTVKVSSLSLKQIR